MPPSRMSRSRVSSFLFSFLALIWNRNRRNPQTSKLRQIVQVDGAFDRYHGQLLGLRGYDRESDHFPLFDSRVDLTDFVLLLRGDDLAPPGSTQLRANRFQVFY